MDVTPEKINEKYPLEPGMKWVIEIRSCIADVQLLKDGQEISGTQTRFIREETIEDGMQRIWHRYLQKESDGE